MNENPFRHYNLKISDGPGTSTRDITEQERSRPVYFPTESKPPHPTWGEAAQSSFALYGWIPSLYIGTHVGWLVSGKQYPQESFEEYRFPGCFTGASPVGLTWKDDISR